MFETHFKGGYDEDVSFIGHGRLENFEIGFLHLIFSLNKLQFFLQMSENLLTVSIW